MVGPTKDTEHQATNHFRNDSTRTDYFESVPIMTCAEWSKRQ